MGIWICIFYYIAERQENSLSAYIFWCDRRRAQRHLVRPPLVAHRPPVCPWCHYLILCRARGQQALSRFPRLLPAVLRRLPRGKPGRWEHTKNTSIYRPKVYSLASLPAGGRKHTQAFTGPKVAHLQVYGPGPSKMSFLASPSSLRPPGALPRRRGHTQTHANSFVL